MREEMRTYGTGSLRKKGRFWQMRYYWGSELREESTRCEDKKSAERVLRKRLREIDEGSYAGPAAQTLTVLDVCNLVAGDYELHRKRSARDVQYRIDKHLAGPFGKISAGALGDEQITAYVTARRAQKASDSTINRELSIVRRGYTLAVRRHKITAAPYIPKLDESGNVRQGFLEHDQYSAVLREMPEHLQCLFVCAYHLGMRLGELRKLRWEQVDLEAREIRLTPVQTKNKKPRTAPIYGDMLAWLEMQKRAHDEWWPACSFLFHYSGKPIGSHVKGWSEACTRAGVPGLLRHDLRRTAVRNMIRAGVPEKVAREISGHRSSSMLDRYNIVSGRDIAVAGARTERYLEEQAAKQNHGKNMGSDQDASSVGRAN